MSTLNQVSGKEIHKRYISREINAEKHTNKHREEATQRYREPKSKHTETQRDTDINTQICYTYRGTPRHRRDIQRYKAMQKDNERQRETERETQRHTQA